MNSNNPKLSTGHDNVSGALHEYRCKHAPFCKVSSQPECQHIKHVMYPIAIFNKTSSWKKHVWSVSNTDVQLCKTSEKLWLKIRHEPGPPFSEGMASTKHNVNPGFIEPGGLPPPSLMNANAIHIGTTPKKKQPGLQTNPGLTCNNSRIGKSFLSSPRIKLFKRVSKRSEAFWSWSFHDFRTATASRRWRIWGFLGIFHHNFGHFPCAKLNWLK